MSASLRDVCVGPTWVPLVLGGLPYVGLACGLTGLTIRVYYLDIKILEVERPLVLTG